MTWLDRLLGEVPRQAPQVARESAPGTDPTLEALCAGLPDDDARALREERAGILEYQAAFIRGEAERRAGIYHDRLGQGMERMAGEVRPAG